MKKNKGAASPKSGRAVKGGKSACIVLEKGERLTLKGPGLSSRKPGRKKEDR